MIKIKWMLTLSFIFIIHACGMSQQPDFKGTLYIVRHAEKDTGANPALSAAGKLRAGDLYRQLKGKKIDLILVSQYRRSAMTADSLRIYDHIDTVQYKADATGASVAEVLAAYAGTAKNILIIGHSNTVPMLVKNAGVQDYVVKDLADDEYDNLFIVDKTKGAATLTSKKYGKLSQPNNGAPSMKISQ